MRSHFCYGYKFWFLELSVWSFCYYMMGKYDSCADEGTFTWSEFKNLSFFSTENSFTIFQNYSDVLLKIPSMRDDDPISASTYSWNLQTKFTIPKQISHEFMERYPLDIVQNSPHMPEVLRHGPYHHLHSDVATVKEGNNF